MLLKLREGLTGLFIVSAVIFYAPYSGFLPRIAYRKVENINRNLYMLFTIRHYYINHILSDCF